MKNTAKFRRSLRYLWMETRLGPVIWIDETSHFTEEQWSMLSSFRMSDSAWITAMHHDSSWISKMIRISSSADSAP